MFYFTYDRDLAFESEQNILYDLFSAPKNESDMEPIIPSTEKEDKLDCSGPGDFCEIGNKGDEIQWCITVPPCDGSAKLMTPKSSGVILGKRYCT